MLIPSARIGINTQRKVTKLIDARTSTRTAVCRGFRPKTSRLVRFTRASGSLGKSRLPDSRGRVSQLPTLRVRRERFESLCDRNVYGRVAGASCHVHRETVPFSDSGQDARIERHRGTTAVPAAVVEL